MYSFEYKKPSSIKEASANFSSSEDGSYLAGGMTLIPTLKQRLAMPTDLIDLSSISELQTIEVQDDTITIGSMCSHKQVHESEEIKNHLPALSQLACKIGDPQVRNRGTIGGSIANNDPSADYPAALLALSAKIQTSERIINADDFFIGLFETALNEGEIITNIILPFCKTASYKKFPNPASGYAVVGAFVLKDKQRVRVAITGAGPNVFRINQMEETLERKFSEESIEDIKVPSDNLNSDLHATSEYRSNLINVMVKRAIREIKKL
jgi:carbon-monoxide dehydrogenase medium subunit